MSGGESVFANVRILNAPFPIDKSYCYEVPLQLEKHLQPGSVVVVPFGGGNSTKNAVVESLCGKTELDAKKIKPILGVPGKYLFIKPELLELCHFMSNRLFCSVGDAAKCVLPSGLGVERTEFYTPLETPLDPTMLEKLNISAKSMYAYLTRTGRASLGELRTQFGSGAASGARVLCELGLCRAEEGYECTLGTKNEKYAALIEDGDFAEKIEAAALTPKQKAAYEVLLAAEAPMAVSELTAEAGCGKSVVEQLAKKNLIRLFEKNLDRTENLLTAFDQNEYGDFSLSEEQNAALQTLLSLYEAPTANAALLWGVTGSGKTNVILKLIDRVLADGKTVIVLVPEIALTSQTVGRFAARYQKDGIALIHSALSVGERTDAWKKIHDGNAKIVIGTRSAVFAPIDNIGLIVMDEEHEGSFKSDQSPKYHARDIAKFRCVYHKALLVMASATPCIESFYKAKTGKYTLVTLKNRYGGKSLPDVTFYDMKTEPYYELPEDAFDAAKDAASDPFLPSASPENATASRHAALEKAEEAGLPLVLGTRLKQELTDCLDRGEQAILFVNRRGYRAFALCRGCGYVFTCPNCSVSLTHHKLGRTGQSMMVCHYCGYREPIPTVCPACKKEHISFVGSGTQLVEETLAKRYPKARVLRMDADTTGGKNGHERILTDFRAGKADILVGTQMVAKGHDFPKVSLVGVVMADTSLFVNDFRAGEKTFSLLTQVLGRAGRSDKVTGRAIVQTYVPDNEILRLAASQDYEKFYNAEIAFRKASVFPPFCDLVTVNFASPVEHSTENAVKIFGAELDTLAKTAYSDVKFILYGPFRNEIYKLAGKYRMRFLIKCRASARMREMLTVLLKKYIPAFKDVSVSVDVNPTNL